MIKKFRNYKAGMTYVELIVVLSIFSVLSSVAIYNYGDFQARVDIKNMGSDIALKIVEAQKSALSGVFPSQSTLDTWKPSYGVYFDLATDNKSFIYFVDLNNDTFFDGTDCVLECLNKISIIKNNYILGLNVYSRSNPTLPVSKNDLTVTFLRPNSGAIISSGSSVLSDVSYAKIIISSPQGATSSINVYASGRIQID